VKKLSEDRLQQAAEWHVILHSDDPSDQEVEEFEIWCATRENARAYQEIEKVWGIFDPVSNKAGSHAVKSILEEQTKVQSRRTQRALATTMSLFLIALIGFNQWVSRPDYSLFAALSPAYFFSDYRTGVGEIRSITLDDGTELTLGTFTAVNVSLDPSSRRIELVRGEVDAAVAGDAKRPFTVFHDEIEVTALGTRYSVHDDADGLMVNVTESRVQVCHTGQAQSASACTSVNEGAGVRVSGGETGPVIPINQDLYLDWSHSTLVVDDQPVTTVLNEFQRYYPGKLSFNAEELEGIRVSGVFKVTSILESLTLLGRSASLVVTDDLPYMTQVRKRK
jgi:transmembrane sensor